MVARLGGYPRTLAGQRPGVDINHNFNAGWAALQLQERAAGIGAESPAMGRPSTRKRTRNQSHDGALPPLPVPACDSAPFPGEEIYWDYGPRTPERSRLMAEILASASGYTVARPSGLASAGGFKDWFIEETGRPGFTIELGRGTPSP